MEDLTKLLGSVTAEDTADQLRQSLPTAPISTADEIKARCMGMIGRAQFCIATACTIANHDTSKFHPKPGLYIRVPKRMDQCYCEPTLPDESFDAELASELLRIEDTSAGWASTFGIIPNEGVKMSAEGWGALRDRRERAKKFTTPKKERKTESTASLNLSHISDSLKEIKNEQQADRDPTELDFRIEKLENQIELIGERLEDWALDQKMKELQKEQEKEELIATIVAIQTQLGDIPTQIHEDAEPSIWANLATLIHESKERNTFEKSSVWKRHLQYYKTLYTQYHAERKSHEDFVQTVVTLCTQFKTDLIHLNQITKILKADVNLLSNPTTTSPSLFGSIQDQNYLDVMDLNSNYRDLLEKYELLNESVKAFATGGDRQPETVEIGNMTFHSRDDLKMWVKKQSDEMQEGINDGSFPFGVFLDVYSFLARIQTYADTKDTMLKNLDLNQRTNLTSDEVTTLSAFSNMIPLIFGRASGNSALSSTKTTFLPAMREKEDWETISRDGGIKRIIEDQIKNVLCQMRDLISSRLYGRSEAIMLATTCLSLSQAFVIDLSRFISDTHSDLEMSGFPPKASWLLVTKLVVRIFGTDLDRVRSFMRGKMDTLDHTQLATDSLWATLRTLAVMQEYQKHGIENHPAISAISAEYVRFLVFHSAQGSITKFDTQIKGLEDKVKEALTAAKAAQSSAGTAQNTANEAKKLAGGKKKDPP